MKLKMSKRLIIFVLTALLTFAVASIMFAGTVSVTKVSVTTSKSIKVGESASLTATVSPSSATNKSVTWSSGNSSVATVDSGGTVTGIGAGTATITVKTNDGGKTDTCKVTVSTVSVSSVSITSSTTIIKGQSTTLTPTVNPSNATNKNVTWSTSNSSVASVSNGTVTANGGGTATITVASVSNSSETDTCKVTVTVPVTSVSLNSTSASLVDKKTLQLTASVSPSDATNKNVTWKTSSSSIASVSSSGLITANGNGTATITATTSDGGITATCSVSVTVPVSSVSVSSTETIDQGESITLSASVSPSDATNKGVSWSSDNSSVATVTSGGTVTGVSAGVAIIKATTVDGSKTDTCKVTVKTVPVSSVSITSTAEIIKGKTTTLTPTVYPSNATNKSVTWSTSNSSVASVSNGTVTANGGGTATITVTTVDGSETDTCKVTVIVPVTSVSLSSTSASLMEKKTLQLTASVSPSDATDKSVSWKTSSSSIASVSSSGLVTANGGGTATITVITDDGGKTATCSVSVTVPVSNFSISSSSRTMYQGETETLSSTVSPSDATNKSVTWSTSNSSVATVDNTGAVTAVITGNLATLKATITGKTDDGGISDSCEITVKPVLVSSVKITNVYSYTKPLGVGETLKLEAAVLPANATDQSITWSSSDNSIATVDSTGLITSVAVGTAKITVRSDSDSTEYDSLSLRVVPVAVESVNINYSTKTITQGKTYALKATVLPTTATDMTVIWSSSDESIATVNNVGLVSAISGGEATIIATTVDGGKTDTCTVTVTAESEIAPDMIIDRTSGTLSAGSLINVSIADDTKGYYVYYKWDKDSSHTTYYPKAVVGTVKVPAVAGPHTLLVRVSYSSSSKLNYETYNYTVGIPIESVSLNKSSSLIDIGKTETLTATVLPNEASDKTVSWTSSDNTIVIVDSTGTIAGVKLGEATITATTTDGGKTAICTVTVKSPSTTDSDLPVITLNPDSGIIDIGSSIEISATDSSGIKEIDYHWDTNVTTKVLANSVTIDVPTTTGLHTLYVNAVDNLNKPSAVQTKSYTLNPIGTTISVELSKTSISIVEGGTENLTATVLPSTVIDKSVSWTSSDNTVAKVVNGTVTAVKVGTVTIKATSLKDTTKSASCLVNITALPPIEHPVTSVSIKSSLTIYEQETEIIKPSISPSNATLKDLSWSSSDSSIAKVDGDGAVTGVSEGIAYITAKSVDGSDEFDTCKVTVKVADVSSVSLNVSSSRTLVLGNSLNLVATVYPSYVTNPAVTWSSSDNSVATVDSMGNVTSVGVGKAKIIVKTVIGGKTDYVYVNVVTSQVESVSLNYSTRTIIQGKTYKLKATVKPTTATDMSVIWTSSDDSVATVDSTGLVTAVSGGTAIITVTTDDGEFTDTCTVTVTADSELAPAMITDPGEGTIIAGSLITVKISDSTRNFYLYYKWDKDSSHSTTFGKGEEVKVKAPAIAGPHTLLLRASYTSSAPKDYETYNFIVGIPVTSVSLDKSNISIDQGKTQKLIATISPSNATNTNLIWTSSDNKKVMVSNDGTVAGITPGTATITVTTEEGEKTATCIVTVNASSVPTNPNISINPTTPTKGKVTVTITYPVDVTVKSYNINGGASNTYTAPFTVSDNCTVYASGANTAGNWSGEVSYVINNIDKIAPINPSISINPTASTNGNVTVTITYPADATVKSYNINGGASNSYTAPFTLSSNCTVYAVGADLAGNWSGEVSYTISNIMKPAPTNPSISINPTTPTKGNVTVTITYPADATTKSYNINGGASNSYTAPFIVSNNCTIYASGANTAGNWSGEVSYVINNIDKIAPINPSISINPTSSTNGNVTVTITYPADATVKSYNINGGASNTYTAPFTVSDNCTIYAAGANSSGNWSGEVSYAISNIDRIIPTNPSISINPAASTNGNVTVTIIYPSDATIKSYNINGGASNSYTAPFILSSNCTVYAAGADSAGNWSGEVSYTISNMDVGAPIVTITSNPSTSVTNSSSIVYKFTFNENVIGFVKDDIIVTNGTKGTFSGSGTTYTLEVSNSGSYTQTVSLATGMCTDIAGNGNTAGSKNIIIDRVGPTGSISINGGAITTDYEIATLTLSATDATTSVAGMKISNNSDLSGANWETYSTSKSWNLVGGNNTIYVAFRDTIYNESVIYSATIKYEILPTLNAPSLNDEIYKGYDTVLSSTGTNIASSSYRIYYTNKTLAPSIIENINNPGTGWTDSGITGSMNTTGTTNISKTILASTFSNVDWTHVVLKVGVGSGTGNWVVKYTTPYSLNDPNDIIGYIGHNQVITIASSGKQIVVSDPAKPVLQYGPYDQNDINKLNGNNTFEHGKSVKYRLEFDMLKPSEITKLKIYFDYNFFNSEGIQFLPNSMVLKKLNDNGSITSIKTFTTDIEKQDGVNVYDIIIEQSQVNTIGRYFVECSGVMDIEQDYYGTAEQITSGATIELFTSESKYAKTASKKAANRKTKINTKTTRGIIQYH